MDKFHVLCFTITVMIFPSLPDSTEGAGEGDREGEKVCSFSLASGTGLTMNLRPAEWTTCAVALGEMSVQREKSQHAYFEEI